MRMIYMKTFLKKDPGEEHNFWMSYTDLMSGFLIVFIIASVVATRDYQRKERENAKVKHELDSLHSSMRNLISEFQFLSQQVADDNSVDVKMVVNDERGSIQIYHKNPKEFLFPQQGKPELPNEAMKLFLQKYGKPIIEKTMSLATAYPNIELRIEGHTDPSGFDGRQMYGSEESFLENMRLSTKRANEVYIFLYNDSGVGLEERHRSFLRNHAISLGYSFSERIKSNTHEMQHADEVLDNNSRRIEFRVIAKSK